jgi:hypothetical protein
MVYYIPAAQSDNSNRRPNRVHDDHRLTRRQWRINLGCADPFSSYHSGFEVRTYWLCRVFHHFDEAEAALFVSSTSGARAQGIDSAHLVHIIIPRLARERGKI